ncbi:MAG TPA: hypothetical protein VM490_26125, partial [Armatimonadaceae bacterium]|nr:hypothetical protein [Armatimonadaceae bacterium]
GVAYVYDEDGRLAERVTEDPSLLRECLCEESDVASLKFLLERHVKYSDSGRAKALLADWDAAQEKFVKVISREYKELLARRAAGASPAAGTLNGTGRLELAIKA